MDREVWAKETAHNLGMPNNWSLNTLEIWLRDECKCVYCGRKMIEDRDTAYFFWSIDHLLPVSRYAHLQDEPWNQVLACRPCNGLKSTFDPAKSGAAADKECRQELIERAKSYIAERKKDLEAVFVLEKQKLQAALEGYRKSMGAGA